MKILFLARRFLYFRNFESVIRTLAARGHALHLAVEHDDAEGRPALVDAILRDCPTVTCGYAPTRADDDWAWLADRLRLGVDSLRYQHEAFDDAPKLKARARERTPGVFVALNDLVGRHARWARRPVSALFQRLEAAVPEDPAIRAFIVGQRPDVVLITPLIALGSSQIEYLRAARQLGIPTAMCVWSWDHLSSKALVREIPERVFVWNDTQKREAIELHSVPQDRVVVTGAQCFDQWFDRAPSRDRATFCRDVGLQSDRPFVLYVCSAPFLGSPPEAPFVLEWIRYLREHADPMLASAPILVRPHPSRLREWEGVDLAAFGDVVLRGSQPIDPVSRADYFDALFHSAAVVGLNTSAFIEAGIVGRPVLAILAPAFAESQMGTVHFRYLLEAGGGLLEVAKDLERHATQLLACLASPQAGVVRPFVRAFVRPHGLDVPATPLFVAAVEAMRGAPVDAPRSASSRPLARWVLRAMAARRADPRFERWWSSERELAVLARNRERHARLAEREAALRTTREAARDVRRAERRRALEEHRAARTAAELVGKAGPRP